MSTAETPKAKMIVLVSSDGQEFEVERATAVESETIKLMINDERADNIAPVPVDVHSKILAPVIQYCKTHAEAAAVHGAAAAMEYTEAFDTEFLKVDQSTLFDLILVRSDCSVFDCFAPRFLCAGCYSIFSQCNLQCCVSVAFLI